MGRSADDLSTTASVSSCPFQHDPFDRAPLYVSLLGFVESLEASKMIVVSTLIVQSLGFFSNP